jgi:hypothetical protein
MAADLRAVSGTAVGREGVEVFAICAATLLACSAALAQIVDYGLLDMRIRALNSNTHASIFGGISLLASAAALAAAVALARRARDAERVVLALAVLIILALRVIHPTHVVVVSLPVTATALVILCRQFTSSGSRILLVGCSLLVLSFMVHALLIGARSPVTFAHDSWAYQFESLVKHDAELAGWILIAAGLVSVRRSVPHRAPTHRPSFRAG